MTKAQLQAPNWRDLGPRVTSAIVLVLIGVIAIALGHMAFVLLVLVAAVIGLWEFYSMVQHKRQSEPLSKSDMLAVGGYFILFALGIAGLIWLSGTTGRLGILYVISLVAVTDTLGYFVGRSLGGRKFWPSISPKKTWAGIIGGWGGAFVLSLLVGSAFGAKPVIVFVFASVLLSFASQLGDIAQSAVKRRMGVKDSSNIIPGHGGILDRFDALLAVGALSILLSTVA